MDVQHKQTRQLLTKTSGFLRGYSHSLNPFVGCIFGCSYCYVRRMPVALFRNQEWGTWIDVKKNAGEQLKKELVKAKQKGAVTIFMSSSTDPYQPIEHQEQITRSLIEVMVDHPPDFLFVQTRSPLVTRDIDLFRKLKERIRISMTIETDLDHIRKSFSSTAPPIAARIRALSELTTANIPTQAAISPLLPYSQTFPKMIKEVTNRVCIDNFFMGDGSQGKRTQQLGIKKIFQDLDLEEWYHPDFLQKTIQLFQQHFTPEQIRISREGFHP